MHTQVAKESTKANLIDEEKPMSNEMNAAKQAIHDKFESQIKTAAARLDTLTARAEDGKANLEIKAVAALMPKKQMIQKKLQALKKSGGDRWQQAKTDLEKRITEFEQSVKQFEAN
jgi:hypothetical protein